ncbi:MAG: HAD hydrolase-like protein [Muribaculaceae bacterium]|nr:HAD hydrolase-like protein [Muribaculaceae bacterium]MDE6791616.1 HAD hydrolase-like protein [Muribaculaceae bacterium]
MSSVDYDLTRIKGFAFDVDGVLSPSTIPLGEDGYPRRMVNIKDGYALQLAVKRGYKIAIITGGKGEAIQTRFESLGIKDIFTGASKKLPIFIDWMKKCGLQPEEVVFMGDDIPDLPCLRKAGLPCAPYDAAWEAKETARYISPFTGGYGCGRDILEQTMKAQDKWLSDEDAFGW